LEQFRAAKVSELQRRSDHLSPSRTGCRTLRDTAEGGAVASVRIPPAVPGSTVTLAVVLAPFLYLQGDTQGRLHSRRRSGLSVPPLVFGVGLVLVLWTVAMVFDSLWGAAAARDRAGMITLVNLTTLASPDSPRAGTGADDLFGASALATTGDTVAWTIGAMLLLPPRG
jgi:hypothetical protein